MAEDGAFSPPKPGARDGSNGCRWAELRPQIQAGRHRRWGPPHGVGPRGGAILIPWKDAKVDYFLMRSGLAGVKDGAVFERLVFSKTGYDTRREFGALRRGFQPGILVRDQPDSSLRARPVLPEMVGHEPDRT